MTDVFIPKSLLYCSPCPHTTNSLVMPLVAAKNIKKVPKPLGFEVPFYQLVYSQGPSDCETALVLSAPVWIWVK